MSHASEIARITIVGMCINVVLAAIKLAVGILAGSAALVADGVHSLSDLSTDLAVLVGLRFSSRPPDETHTYGHGKYETAAASIIGLVLVVIGLLIVWDAGVSLYNQEEHSSGYAVLAVAVVAIVSKEWIYRATQRVARRVKSTSLRGNAWHHRSDALSSIAVLFGAILGLVGWGHGDQVAAMAVGALITMVGFIAMWTAFVEFTECSVSPQERRLIVNAIRGVHGVKGWHRIRTRIVGREIFMDLHILVDPQLSVTEGHEVCTAVETAIGQSVDRPINVIVHCEPNTHSEASEYSDTQD